MKLKVLRRRKKYFSLERSSRASMSVKRRVKNWENRYSLFKIFWLIFLGFFPTNYLTQKFKVPFVIILWWKYTQFAEIVWKLYHFNAYVKKISAERNYYYCKKDFQESLKCKLLIRFYDSRLISWLCLGSIWNQNRLINLKTWISIQFWNNYLYYSSIDEIFLSYFQLENQTSNNETRRSEKLFTKLQSTVL